MSVGEQTDQKVLDELFLTDNDLAHLKGQHVHEGTFLLDPVVQFFDVNAFHVMSFLYFCVSTKA